MSQQRNGQAVWGYLLIGLGALFLITQFLPGWGLAGFVHDLIGAGLFGFAAAVIYLVYAQNRARRWLLIPAYVMAVIAAIIVLDAFLPDGSDLVGAFVLFAIAAPFFYVYFNNRANWWALIPGGIMALIGAGVLMGAVTGILPLLLIAAGLFLLLRHFTGEKRGEPLAEGPLVAMEPIGGPQVDRPNK